MVLFQVSVLVILVSYSVFLGLSHVYMLLTFCWIFMSIHSETNQKDPAVKRKISSSSMHCLAYASIWTYESFDLNTLTSSNAQWWQGWKFLDWKAFWAVQMVRNVPASAGDIRDWVWSLSQGDPLGEGNGNPLQYSHLENPMDRGAWQATVCGVTKSLTWLGDRHFHS